jgi:uroporphyrinogen III methyltransferase/synthase
MSGVVFLVGGGPGDPRLLTARALELLSDCDVVAYDLLISDAVLACASPEAELVCVGHRGHGSPRAVERIHPEVIARARAGQRVVRLKCGDPFVFGRGGEEAEELLAAGVPFEIVPGISSALGAAAYAGIPLTHRGRASSVTLQTGHDAGERATGTVVLFMAAKKLGENLQRLIAEGRAPSTPAAYVAGATTAAQRTFVGTLADLPSRVGDADPEVPALVVVGDVVALREKLSWLEARPLHGRRVLVARARPGASQLAAKLRALGAETLEAPVIDTLPLDDTAALDDALDRLSDYDALVFACADGVDALLARLGARGGDVRALLLSIVAIGAQARDRLLSRALQPAATVEGACAEALSATMLRSGRLLLVTSEEGRPSLYAELSALGANVDTVAAYRVRRTWPRVSRQRFDAVVLPSSSAAAQLYASEFGAALAGVPAVAIGPLTEAAARHHATHVVRAARDTIESAVDATRELLGARPSVADEPRPEALA